MATPSTNAPISQPLPGERSSRPMIALLLGWLLPGAGHFFVGKPLRALLLFISILGMMLIGLGLGGKIYSPNTGEILDMLGFAGQLGLGALFLLGKLAGWGTAAVLTTPADWGTKFIVGAGLLNVIAAVDAHSLANGRKAS
jgi:hypothetical protein